MKFRRRYAVLPTVLAVCAALTAVGLSRNVSEAAEVQAAPGAVVTMAGMVRPGPEKVTVQEYDFGDSAARLPGVPAPVELRGVVHRPVNAAGRKLPLVVFLHGIQVTCFAGADQATTKWPCPTGLKPVASYRGYDYLAANLASYGFVVASVSANGITASDRDAEDMGMLNRAHLIERHLQKFARWNSTGGAPFGKSLAGAIDPARVGLMGHSRGGGGVARFMALEQTTGFTVKAVLPLAAAPYGHQVITGAALAVVEATCDGNTYQHQGVSLVDGSRYAAAGDPAPKYTVTIEGGNHSFFNTVWSPSAHWLGGEDDSTFAPEGSICRAGSPGRLNETEQRRYAVAYINSFFRLHLAGDRKLAPVWTGATAPAGPVVQVTRIPGVTDRLVINRLDDPRQLRENVLGGTVTQAGLHRARICSNETPLVADGPACLTDSRVVPTQSSPHHSWGDLHLAKVAWSRPDGSLTNAIPARNGDFSKFTAIQLRAALDFSDKRNPLNKDGALTITLTDAAGLSRKVDARSPALAFPRMMTEPVPPGQEDLSPHFLLNQVRIPLSSFAGVDLTRVRSVRLGFPAPSGSLGLSDLMLSR
jgi:dienelactone hydrolase